MKTLIILCSFLALQTCNQTKNKQKSEKNTPVEYRETVVLNSEKENSTPTNTNDENQPIAIDVKKSDKAIQDTILNNIQEKITTASYDGFAKRNTKKLDEVESFLDSHKTENENLKKYWIAYINYYKTIIAMQLKDKDLGSKSNKKGIDLLVNNQNKNSDDYALLALLKGMSYPFVSGMEAPAISKDINKYLEKGIEADDKNFRVYYAQGSIDFYTPKEYGGGTKTETALLKAINLPEKNKGNSQLPTWGKEETYDLIIRFYLREDQKDKAKTYFDKAKQLFPDSYIIQMHQSNFKS